MGIKQASTELGLFESRATAVEPAGGWLLHAAFAGNGHVAPT